MVNVSRVGVIDKSVAILDALEFGPLSLAELVETTGVARPTAHRLAVALESHGMVARDSSGRFRIGARIGHLAAAADDDVLSARARPILRDLRDATGESAQLYRRRGDRRLCVAVADRESGLRDTVPLGATLTMTAGSAAQVLLAWDDTAQASRLASAAAFTAGALSQVRQRGWAVSVGEREPGVASVSAPVRAPGGRVVAAVSVSGPAQRLKVDPAQRFTPALLEASVRISALLAGSATRG